MTLTFKKRNNFVEELIINCFSYVATKDAIYYKESKYGQLNKVDSKEFCLWNVQR